MRKVFFDHLKMKPEDYDDQLYGELLDTVSFKSAVKNTKIKNITKNITKNTINHALQTQPPAE